MMCMCIVQFMPHALYTHIHVTVHVHTVFVHIKCCNFTTDEMQLVTISSPPPATTAAAHSNQFPPSMCVCTNVCDLNVNLLCVLLLIHISLSSATDTPQLVSSGTPAPVTSSTTEQSTLGNYTMLLYMHVMRHDVIYTYSTCNV